MTTTSPVISRAVEPADLDFVRTGAKWPYTFWQRDEQAAKDCDGWAEPGASWWDCAREDGGDGPFTWDFVSSLPDPKLITFTAPDLFAAPASPSVEEPEDVR